MLSLKYDRRKGVKTSGHLSVLWALCLIFWGIIFFEKFQVMFGNDVSIFTSNNFINFIF